MRCLTVPAGFSFEELPMNAEERNQEIARKRELIKNHQKALHALELQKAKFGIYVPHYIQTEIDEIQKHIKDLEAEIERLQSATDEQEDQPTPIAQNPGVDVDKTTLRRRMLENYDDPERLAILCTDINTRLKQAGSDVRVSPAIVGGQGLEAIIMRLIDYLDRRRLLNVLLEALRSDQPDII
jgi:DNA repair exonuclease SbcCD ATPase subunit